MHFAMFHDQITVPAFFALLDSHLSAVEIIRHKAAYFRLIRTNIEP